MQSHPRHRSGPTRLAILAIAVLALAIVTPTTVASQTSPPGPPNFPSAVPTRPGALSYSSDRTAPPVTAQARPIGVQAGPPNFPTAVPTRPGALTYSSDGTPARVTAQVRPIGIDTNDGVAWLTFALALAGALIVGFAASSSLHVLHARSRRRAGQPA